jgi:hypothetical protein
MSKSWIYVPGLAMADAVCRQARTSQAFQDKVNSAFSTDVYMRDMVSTLLGKGAVPADCRQSLRWIEIPRAGAVHKALKKLSGTAHPVSSNVLAKTLDAPAAPMKMSVGIALTPCTAPEFIAQPMPSTAVTKSLAEVAKGDKLYIVGHSNALGGSLTYKWPALGHVVQTTATPTGCAGWQHAEKRHIDPVTLASLLVNEGLRPGIKFDIVMVACYSGGLDDEDLQTVQCFSQRLAGTLAARGYTCPVYGATGLTSSNSGEVRVAKGATKQADGSILLNASTTETLADQGSTPFYRRFFRVFGG